MAPSAKSAAAPKDRRKSNGITANASAGGAAASKPGRFVVTLKVSPQRLRAVADPDSVMEDAPAKPSPAPSATPTTTAAAGAAATAPSSHAENGTDSAANSPPADGTPAAQSAGMGPPTEGPKKKGVKRSAGAAAANGNGEPKLRGKPGPKKKQRLEDGTMEGGRSSLGPHRLGPKANQGAINAGLRALDRSGKPCRKWTKGGFTLKSFTGVVWEIPRWTAPPRSRPESSVDGSTPASAADSSSKENNNKEDDSQVKSEASNNGGDVEMQSAPSVAADPSPAPAPAPTPAPMPIAAV